MGKDPRDFKEKYGPWSIVIGASMGIGAACAKRLYVLISLMILDI